MKKLFMVWMTLIFGISVAGAALGQEKSQKGEPAAVSQPAATKSAGPSRDVEVQGTERTVEKDQVFAKPHIWRMGGLVTAVDPQAKTLSFHQETVNHDWVIRLKVNEKEAKELSNFKPGDLVNVWVNGRVIEALKKVV